MSDKILFFRLFEDVSLVAWSLCTLYSSHARWSHRRRLESLLLWACLRSMSCVTSIVRAQLRPIVCWFFRLTHSLTHSPLTWNVTGGHAGRCWRQSLPPRPDLSQSRSAVLACQGWFTCWRRPSTSFSVCLCAFRRQSPPPVLIRLSAVS